MLIELKNTQFGLKLACLLFGPFWQNFGYFIIKKSCHTHYRFHHEVQYRQAASVEG